MRGSELQIGGLPVSKITELYGTPLFIYDSNVLAKKLTLLRGALPPGFKVFYSVKANPNPTILSFWLSKGCGLEVASGGEFHQAMAIGCPPSRVLFAGPGKTEMELELVLEHGIGEIHVESSQEIDRIVQICRRRGLRGNIAIRVNPSSEAQGGAMRMGGKPTPFGVDEEMLDEVLDQVLREQVLNFRGIHLFAGTQILDHTILISQYRKALQIAYRAASRAQVPAAVVDFGGGLGIPYHPNDRVLDITRFGKELSPIIEEAMQQPEFAGTTFVVEPGRYLVGEGGIYVSRITAVKKSRGKKFLIVDGGMHHHLAASGNLGQVIKRNFPVAILNKLGENPEEIVDVVGPLCTPLDVLARDVHFPAGEVGDLVGVFQSGAYARTSSPLGFLSHPTPPEVWLDGGEASLIRPRGTYEDFTRDYL